MATIPILEAVMPAIHTDGEERLFGSRAAEWVHLLDFIPTAQHAAIANLTSTYDAWEAFNNAIESYGVTSGAFGHNGPEIRLPRGKVYISQPLHIKRTISIIGSGGSYHDDQGHTSQIEVAANQHGIIVHSFDSYALTSVTTAWATGQTYTVGTVRYVSAGNIYSVAVQGPGTTSVSPSHSSGSVSGADGYSWTWLATARKGTSCLFKSFRLKSLSLGGAITSGGTGTVGHGMWLRTRAVCQDLYVDGFAQDGYHIVATDSASTEFRGNANNWHIYGGRCSENGGNGLFIDGSDVNSGATFGADFSNNQGWGIHDSSFLGCFHHGASASNNGVEEGAERQYDGYRWTCVDEDDGPTEAPGSGDAWWANSRIGTSILWTGLAAYVAGSNTIFTPTTHAVYSCTIAGGGNSTNEPTHLTGAQAYADGYTWTISTTAALWTSGDTTIIEGGAYKFDGSSNQTIGFGCYVEGSQPIHLASRTILIAPGVTRSDLTGNSSGTLWNGSAGFSQLVIDGTDSTGGNYDWEIGKTNTADDFLARFIHDDYGEWRIVMNTDGTLSFEGDGGTMLVMTLSGTTIQFGRGADQEDQLYVPNLFLGSGTTDSARQLDSGSAAPTSGACGLGDFRINNAPAHAEPIGWRNVSAGSPGTWEPIENRTSYQTVSSDAAFSLTPLTSPHQTRHTGVLNADRAVTLSTTNAAAGMSFLLTRTGAGAFNLNVGTGPLKALATNTWCQVVYDGSAWYLAAYGAL